MPSEDQTKPFPNVDPLTDPKKQQPHEDASEGSEGSARTIGLGIYKEAEGGHEKSKEEKNQKRRDREG